MRRPLLTLALLCVAGSIAPAQTPYISSFTGATIRNDFTGYVGMKFTVGGSPISVTSVGRACWSGNSASHLVVISNGASTVVSATVNMSGCTPGTFVYASATATLAASTAYYVIGAELSGGDQWGSDTAIRVTTTAVASENGSAFSSTAPPSNPTGIGLNTLAPASYSPANFTYSTGGTSAPRLTLLGVGP